MDVPYWETPMSLQSSSTSSSNGGALVSKAGESPASPAWYLFVTADGGVRWVRDPVAATAFPSMRDATRVAVRLPARLRAFGLPRGAELAVHASH